MPGQISHVLFDLDGTLADTAADLADALNRLRLERGRKPLSVAELRPTVSQGGAAMIRHAFSITDADPEFAQLKQDFLRNYGAGVARHSTLFPGMDDLLDRLERSGYVWGVVTNKVSEFSRPLIDALGLLRRSACLVCGDTTAFLKPHPEPLLHACRTLNCAPSEAVYVGDAERDVQAARGAGMPCVVAGYGYVEGADPQQWAADAIIQHPLGLLDWLEERS